MRPEQDYYERVCDAIIHLEDVLAHAGPDVQLAEIRLKPSRHGRHQLKTALKASPSILSYLIHGCHEDALPPGGIIKIYGVIITQVPI